VVIIDGRVKTASFLPMANEQQPSKPVSKRQSKPTIALLEFIGKVIRPRDEKGEFFRIYNRI